jgi:hypothetical protein
MKEKAVVDEWKLIRRGWRIRVCCSCRDVNHQSPLWVAPVERRDVSVCASRVFDAQLPAISSKSSTITKCEPKSQRDLTAREREDHFFFLFFERCVFFCKLRGFCFFSHAKNVQVMKRNEKTFEKLVFSFSFLFFFNLNWITGELGSKDLFHNLFSSLVGGTRQVP